MRKPLAALAGLAAAALAAPLPAVVPSLVVGDPPSSTANQGTDFAPLTTLIDLSNPANATGSLTQATFGWGGGGVCPSVVKIKVFHRVGSTLMMTGERGPFDSGDDGHGNHKVTLTPPLPIQQGDYIAMEVATTCGFVVSYHNFPTSGFLVYHSDVTGTVDIAAASSHPTDLLALGATGTTTSYTALIVPGVGSLTGAFGSQFKTSLQIIAPPFGGGVTGKIVFHPQGAEGSSSDPSMTLAIGAGRAVAYPDIVAAMGQTGLGSLDIVLDADSGVPTVYARVFNDAGADGTSGLGESAVDPTQSPFSSSTLLSQFCTGHLSAPIDPSKFRLNLGARSLDNGVTVTFTLKDQDGTVRATGHVDLDSNEFVQLKAEDVLGVAPGANDYLEVSVSGGSAIVYGATTDDLTNDPSVQFAYSQACVA